MDLSLTNTSSRPSLNNASSLKSRQLLGQALSTMNGDLPSKIPFLIRLLENPASPVALPGNIDLYRHDCLHLLLDRHFSAYDEAFVVGFTMGNDTRINWFHLAFFKFVSSWFYPNVYRFNRSHLHVFDLGVAYGQAVSVRDINRFDFSEYEDQSLEQLQMTLGIDNDDLRRLQQLEAFVVSRSKAPMDGF